MSDSDASVPAPTAHANSLTSPQPLSPAFSALSLSAAQQDAIHQQLVNVHFEALSLKEIASLGSEPERQLHQTLDGFLTHIDRFENPRLFQLFGELNAEIDQEDLPALADRILNSPPTAWQRFVGFFNKKAMAKALASTWEHTQRLASGKMQTLTDKVRKLEQDLLLEQQRLEQEINRLEQLKTAYRQRFDEFMVATGFLRTLTSQAQEHVKALENSTQSGEPQQAFLRDEALHKLQALQSRTLAVEGTLSRLPSDQLVIRQLQNAGLSTWQETTTTAAARFASIKMTLLTLHSALLTQGVQRMAAQGRALDENLSAVRAQLMRDVVSTSAHMPGDNRLAQAQQLQQIVQESNALQSLVLQARQSNTQKFEQARQLLSQAQREMLQLSQHIRTDLPPRA